MPESPGHLVGAFWWATPPLSLLVGYVLYLARLPLFRGRGQYLEREGIREGQARIANIAKRHVSRATRYSASTLEVSI